MLFLRAARTGAGGCRAQQPRPVVRVVAKRREAVQKRVANRDMACSCPLKNANMPGDFKHVLAPVPSGWSRRPSRWRIGVVGLILVSLARAATEEQPPRPPPEFRRLAPLPAIREAAAVAGLAWSGLAAPQARTGMQPGDSVTVLVSLTKGAELKQWLIRLAMEQPTAGGPLRGHAAARFFTSTGHQFRFSGGTAGIQITMIGPLGASDAGRRAATAPDVKRQRVQVSADFLALGLERTPAVALRVRALRAARPDLRRGNLSIGNQPFPPDVVARDAPRAAEAGITEADERSIIGSVLALQEFFQLTSHTPGLQDVLRSVLDIPWWSILRAGGNVDLNLRGLPFERELNAVEWGLPTTEKAYASPFLLLINGQPALRFQLALVAPKPPLVVSAGIVGLAAVGPDGTGPVLTFQVVSSQASR